MKYKVGIGIFAAIMMVCLCYMGSYQYFYGKKEESGRQMSGELQAEPANAGQGSRIGEQVNKGNGYPFYVKLENGLVAIYEAVSYTHLDVYKRQKQYRPGRTQEADRLCHTADRAVSAYDSQA